MEKADSSHRISLFGAYLEKDSRGDVVEILILKPNKRVFESDLLAEYPHLRKLTLEELKLQNNIWEKIGDLSNLKELTVARTVLDCTGISLLKECKQLRSLDLRCTGINDCCLKEVSILGSIERLFLISTKIQKVDPIANLAKLRSLYLTQTHVCDDTVGAINSCTKLTELSLEGTAITDIGVQKLTNLDLLETLAIHNTQISTRIYSVLRNFPSLTEVYVDQAIDSQSLVELSKMKRLRRIFCGDTIEEEQKLAVERLGIDVF